VKRIACLVLLSLGLLTVTSCMTTRHSEMVHPKISKTIFDKQTVAVLPTRSQANLTTESLLPLKKSIDLKLDVAMPTLLPSSTMINTKKTVGILNDAGQIETLDKLVTSYDSTGVYNKKLVSSLFSDVKCEYMVIPRLKTEKMDFVISKGTGASLEVTIINRAGEVEWSGVGDFKRGGVLGFGGADPNEVAEELVKLAFQNF